MLTNNSFKKKVDLRLLPLPGIAIRQCLWGGIYKSDELFQQFLVQFTFTSF